MEYTNKLKLLLCLGLECEESPLHHYCTIYDLMEIIKFIQPRVISIKFNNCDGHEITNEDVYPEHSVPFEFPIKDTNILVCIDTQFPLFYDDGNQFTWECYRCRVDENYEIILTDNDKKISNVNVHNDKYYGLENHPHIITKKLLQDHLIFKQSKFVHNDIDRVCIECHIDVIINEYNQLVIYFTHKYNKRVNNGNSYYENGERFWISCNL